MIPIKIGEAFVELITDGRKLTAGLNDAEKQVVASTNAMSQKFKAVGTIMTTVGGVITAAFTAIIYKTVQAGDELWDMSQRTGIAVEKLSALGYAAKQSGTDMGTVETSLKFLARAMADTAAGTGAAQKIFNQLGIAVKDTAGNLRPTVEVMKEVATAIAGMTNETEQVNIATELFGSRMGTQILPMLKLGGAGIEELMKKAEELGIVFSAKDAMAADEFKDKMNDLKDVLGAAGRDIANVLIPPLIDFMKWATDIVKKIRDWGEAHKPLIDLLIKTATGLGVLSLGLGTAFLAFVKIIPAIQATQTALLTLASGGTYGLIITAVIAFVAAYKTNFGGIKTITDTIIGGVIKAYEWYIEKTNAFFGVLSEAAKTAAKASAEFGLSLQKIAGTNYTSSFTDLAGALNLVNMAAEESGITTESLTKDIDALSTSFELSQKYISENNKSMSDSIKYYNSMIGLMSNLDSGLKIELETLQAGTEEYKKKVEEIDKNTKALNDMKAALDASLAPLEGLDLIAAKMALLGDTAIDNKTKLGYLGDESILLKKNLDASVPDSTEWWKWNTALATNIQSVKDLSQAIADSQLASLDAKLIYITGKFNEGKASIDGYHKQIWSLEKELPLLQANLDKATPESAEWYAAKTAVEEHKQAIKDLTIAMNDLVAGKDPLKKSLEEEWDAWRKLTFGIKETEKEVDTFGQILKTTFAGATEQINMAKVALSNFTKEGLAAATVAVKMSFIPLINDIKEAMARTKAMFDVGQLGAVSYDNLVKFYTKQLANVMKEMNEQIDIFKYGYAEYQNMIGGTSGGSAGWEKTIPTSEKETISTTKKETSSGWGSYQEGTSYVPKTGLYILHQGEEVKKANQNSYDKRNYSFSPITNIINPVIRNDDDIVKIRREVNKANEDSARQFRRSGFELVPGRG